MNELFSTVAPLAITGALVSALVQYTKDFLSKSTHKFIYVIVASVLLGVVLKFANLIPTNWATTIIGVWASANSVYLAISQFITPSTSPAV